MRGEHSGKQCNATKGNQSLFARQVVLSVVMHHRGRGTTNPRILVKAALKAQ